MPEIKTIADIEAFEETPLEDHNLPDNTYEAIRRGAQRNPEELALAFFLDGRKYDKAVEFTFTEVFENITKAANLFHSLGVGPGDTVSYLLPNLPQSYFTLFGAEAAGIANPINPLLEGETLAEIMHAANTKVLVTIAPVPGVEIWDKVVSIADKVPSLEVILRVDLGQYLSGAKKLALSAFRMLNDKGKVKARVLDFDTEFSKQPGDRLLSGRVIGRDEPASYFHTGGTTGAPKLAVHSHFNEVFDVWSLGQSLGGHSGKRFFLGLPLYHNYGALAVGLGGWSYGSGIVMATPQGFRGEGVMPNLWNILAHYKCTHFAGVPTVYSTLLNLPKDNVDLSALESCGCGAAPLPVEVARQFEEKTGIHILEGYGLTEGTSVSSANPRFGVPRIGSIGLRLPYQEVRAMELDDNGKFVRFCDTDEIGVIAIRGANVFKGYKDDFHNQGVFIDSGDGKGHWLNSGDMGRQDADGFTWLTGRKKELIIRGGHNIDPKQIEEPLHRHPAVALAAAVGRPDPRVGEIPVAYVELKPNTSVTVEELMAFAEKEIGERAAIPRAIHILDQMPLTPIGKILKLPLLREQVREVFEEDLRAIEGLDLRGVVVDGDIRLGTVAYVTVAPQNGVTPEALEAAINQSLDRYSVHYKVEMTS